MAATLWWHYLHSPATFTAKYSVTNVFSSQNGHFTMVALPAQSRNIYSQEEQSTVCSVDATFCRMLLLARNVLSRDKTLPGGCLSQNTGTGSTHLGTLTWRPTGLSPVGSQHLLMYVQHTDATFCDKTPQLNRRKVSPSLLLLQFFMKYFETFQAYSPECSSQYNHSIFQKFEFVEFL